jgi:hypothetical protein
MAGKPAKFALNIFKKISYNQIERLPNSFYYQFWEEDVIKKSFPDFSESVFGFLRRLVGVHANL